MTSSSFLNSQLSVKTSIFGLRLWVVIGIGVGAFIVLILFFLSIWLTSRKKSKQVAEKLPSVMIPMVSKDIKEVRVDQVRSTNPPEPSDGFVNASRESTGAEKIAVRNADVRNSQFQMEKTTSDVDNVQDRGRQTLWKMVGDEGRLEAVNRHRSVDKVIMEGERRGLLGSSSGDKGSNASGDSRSGESPAPVPTVPEVSHLGWGHWYTLRDLELATSFFSDSNVLGEGGYGIVYQGQLPDCSLVAVKNLLNNRGQAEREFRVEVEAIGRVRHKNLVRLLGYCAEGSHRMLVYEYVDNGNLDQWLHGSLGQNNPIPWDGRMKIVVGTAKGLAYLHEGLEPKVVHRDVKSSNILLDMQWNSKISDFGLAKLIGSGTNHVTTRVMGTFGYVAPEYANTGLLNERSDVYSFGVLLMEVITGRDPVDYSKPSGEVNLVDWLKMMVGSRRSEEVVDPKLELKPSSHALKRALLVALRCVDPDPQKRPKMGHVVHMLEADDFPYRDDRRNNRDSSQIRKSPQNHHLSPVAQQGVFQDSAARKVHNKDSPAHRAMNDDNFELVIDSPGGSGYKPRLKRYAA